MKKVIMFVGVALLLLGAIIRIFLEISLMEVFPILKISHALLILGSAPIFLFFLKKYKKLTKLVVCRENGNVIKKRHFLWQESSSIATTKLVRPKNRKAIKKRYFLWQEDSSIATT